EGWAPTVAEAALPDYNDAMRQSEELNMSMTRLRKKGEAFPSRRSGGLRWWSNANNTHTHRHKHARTHTHTHTHKDINTHARTHTHTHTDRNTHARTHT